MSIANRKSEYEFLFGLKQKAGKAKAWTWQALRRMGTHPFQGVHAREAIGYLMSFSVDC